MTRSTSVAEVTKQTALPADKLLPSDLEPRPLLFGLRGEILTATHKLQCHE